MKHILPNYKDKKFVEEFEKMYPALPKGAFSKDFLMKLCCHFYFHRKFSRPKNKKEV